MPESAEEEVEAERGPQRGRGDSGSTRDDWSTFDQLRRWLEGDEGGFEQLFGHFHADIRKRIRGHRAWPYLSARAEPDDLLQEVWGRFIRVVQAGRFHYRGRGSVFALLRVLVDNTLADKCRKELAEKRGGGAMLEDLDVVLLALGVHLGHPAATETPTSAARVGELQDQIVVTLSELEYEAWDLRQREYSFKQIGEALDRTESSVRSIHHRARIKLAQHLEDYQGLEQGARRSEGE